jgi:hypothetical protein
MRSDATSVPAYLKSLRPDRRKAISAVRSAILKRLPKGYEEVMAWGMISYQVPWKVCSAAYNDRPLMYAALASQKNHMAVYLCSVYCSKAALAKLVAGFRKAGKKLDMGKSCIRFKALEDLPLDVIGDAVAAAPMADYVRFAKSAGQAR